MNKSMKITILAALVVSIASLGIAYAALSQTLNLSANVEIMAASLDVRFVSQPTSSLSSVASNGAEVVSEGSITGNTDVTGLSFKLNYPGDYVTTSVDARNYTQYFGVQLTKISLSVTNIDIVADNPTDQNTPELSSTDKTNLVSQVKTAMKITVSKVANETRTQLAAFTNTTIPNTAGVTVSTSSVLPKVITDNGGNETARTEHYEIKTEYLYNQLIEIPEGYHVEVTGIGLHFDYAQQSS